MRRGDTVRLPSPSVRFGTGGSSKGRVGPPIAFPCHVPPVSYFWPDRFGSRPVSWSLGDVSFVSGGLPPPFVITFLLIQTSTANVDYAIP